MVVIIVTEVSEIKAVELRVAVVGVARVGVARVGVGVVVATERDRMTEMLAKQFDEEDEWELQLEWHPELWELILRTEKLCYHESCQCTVRCSVFVG